MRDWYRVIVVLKIMSVGNVSDVEWYWMTLDWWKMGLTPIQHQIYKFEKIRFLEDGMNQNQPFHHHCILEATFRCWMSLARVSIHILGASAIMAVCTFCS